MPACLVLKPYSLPSGLHMALQVCLDGTFQVTQYGWGMYALIAPDEFGEAVPLAYCITSSEGPEPITIFLDTVLSANPTFAPRVIVIDKSGAPCS